MKPLNWENFKKEIGQDDVITSTLLALCIMETFFYEYAGDFVLVEKKAKLYLNRHQFTEINKYMTKIVENHLIK